ncbi:PQQ-dependent sugar dehydrogenase [Corynebacterium sp. A21]|uniref:PQQ-dependent sugar dehydrogenase n=1 Tax=Corynebacterium sp. A21 TaxID=3457318 RepID=UPI003FD24374
MSALSFLCALGSAALLSSCSAAPPTPTTGEALAHNLDAPWSVAFHGDTALISERDNARILELDRTGESREVGVIADASPRGEGGLLGIATQGDYLFTYYTAETDNRIDRYLLEGEPGSLRLGAAETILSGIPAASTHNGGRLAFGPDSMLYATTGDAGDTANSQNLDSLAGKILRMTPEGEVPADNPIDDSLVYSYGHRNPQGIAWDDVGTMYASEFGQNTWDELNLIEAGGNYGWPQVEGIAGESGFIDPLQQWSPADASPSGMTIADGAIYIANLRGQNLREIPLDDLGTSTVHYRGEFGRLRDVTLSPEGDLWVLSNNTDGRGNPAAEDDRLWKLG